MIEPESLDFPPLNCSLDRVLGDYYQDISGAIPLVESGYHGGLDDDGVPLTRYPGQSALYNPITTAQYAIANLTAAWGGESWRGDRARIQADWLVGSQQRAGEWEGCWLMTHASPKYPWLRPPWVSAMASGNAISALLRAWEWFRDERYREAAHLAYRGLHAGRRGMLLYRELDGELWYEEYPAATSLRVLNGHIYTLLGVADCARVFSDEEAESRWRLAAATVLAHLDEYDLGYWSAYDLRWREPASVHYQKNIHVPQLRILAALTGEAGFTEMADRWTRQLDSALSRLRWMVGVRAHRWRRKSGPR